MAEERVHNLFSLLLEKCEDLKVRGKERGRDLKVAAPFRARDLKTPSPSHRCRPWTPAPPVLVPIGGRIRKQKIIYLIVPREIPYLDLATGRNRCIDEFLED